MITRRAFASLYIENPYTFETIAKRKFLTLSEGAQILHQAQKFQTHWARQSLDYRMSIMGDILDDMIQNKEEIAQEITKQIGKPIVNSREEIDFTFQFMKEYMNLAPEALREYVVKQTNGTIKKYVKEPVGVVMSMLAFALPYFTAFSIIVPAVLAGNAVLMKHSPYSLLSAERIQRSFEAKGVPDLVQSCLIDIPLIPRFIEENNIAYIVFTGSSESGHELRQHIVKMHKIQQVGYFLGTKNTVYIDKDADIENAAKDLVKFSMYSSGQSYLKPDRVYAHIDIYEALLAQCQQQLQHYDIGNPLDENTEIGPLTVPEFPAELEKIIFDAVKCNARLIQGGNAVKDRMGKGRFFEPTLICDLEDNMTIFTDECFGPVLPIDNVDNIEEAITRTNNAPFHMMAGIYSQNPGTVDEFVSKIRCGTVFANEYFQGNPRLPWCGWYSSGHDVWFSTEGFKHHYRLKSYSISSNIK